MFLTATPGESPVPSTPQSFVANVPQVDMAPVEAIVAEMQHENVALLAKHAGTSAADRRARVRAEKFTTLLEGLKDAFAIPLLPERQSKRSRDAPDGPSTNALADRLHNERLDFSRSQANAQLSIGSS